MENMVFRNKKANKTELFSDLKKKPRAFVLFYGDWCGHCHTFNKTWNTLCKKVYKNPKLQTLCIESKDIDESMGIKGFPTLKEFKNGRFIDYNGSRNLNDILRYLGMSDIKKRKTKSRKTKSRKTKSRKTKRK